MSFFYNLISERSRTLRMWMFVVLVTSIPLFLLALGMVKLMSAGLQRQAEFRIANAGLAVASAVEHELNDLAVIVDAYSHSEDLRDLLQPRDEADSERAQNVLDQILRIHKGIDLAFLADAKGNTVLVARKSPSSAGQNFSIGDWHREAAPANQPYASGVYRTAPIGEQLAAFATANIHTSMDDSSPVTGMIGAGYDLDMILQLVDELAPEGVRLTVVDQAGQIVPAQRQEPGEVDSYRGTEPGTLAQDDFGVVRQYASHQGESILGVSIPVNGTDWAIVAEMPANAALAPVEEIQAAALGITLLVWILLGLSIIAVNSSQRRRLKAEEELYRSRQDLEEKEAELNLVIPASGLGTAIFNIRTNTFSSSERFENLHGLAPGTLAKDARELFTYIHPEDLAALKSKIKGILVEGRPFNIEYRIIDPRQQSVRWLHSQGDLKEGPNGKDCYVVGAVSDVTCRRNALEAARSMQAFLDSVIDNIPDMVFVKDARSLKFIHLNRAGEQLLGIPREEIIGRGDADVFPPEHAKRSLENDQEVLKSGVLVEIPAETLLTRSGENRILNTKKIPIPDSSGTPEFLLGISRDITMQRQIETELQAARIKADQSNMAKSEFLSKMSHELRTPLNAVLGFGQLLEMSKLTPSQLEYVSQIVRAGCHLLDLINELLNLSRIEIGAMALSIEAVDASEVIVEAMSLVHPLAAQRNITLVNELEGERDLYVRADRQRLSQVLLNLLSNAIKYNSEGGTVWASCEFRAGDRVRIHVKDTGPGISPEQQQRLFMPFERLAANLTEVEGTGLGLSLARGLCEAMDGLLGVESEVGRGSSFWIELHCCDSAQFAAEIEELASHVQPVTGYSASLHKNILYIEDNPSNIQLIKGIFSLRPHLNLLMADQGGTGVEMAFEHSPDLIFLDMNLPDMNGEQVLQQLRADPRTQDVSIIVVSADATPSQVERILAAGANDYLTKPFKVSQFLAVIDHADWASAPEPA